jgi:tetratricopeptide (TPR) repeat protein
MTPEKPRYHSILASYFQRSGFSQRKVRELPWQLMASEQMEQLFSLYSDLPFFHLAWRTDRHETKLFWTKIEEKSSYTITKAYQPVINNPKDDQISYSEDIIDLFFETFHIREVMPLLEFRIQYYRRENYPFHLLRSISQYATALKDTGMFGPSLHWLNEQAKLAYEGGHWREYCTAVGNLAAVNIILSKYEAAMNFLDQQEKLSRQLNDMHNLCICLNNKSMLSRYKGDAKTAKELLDDSESIAKDTDIDLLTACEFNQGVLLYELGCDDEAQLIFESCIEKFTLVGAANRIAAAYGNLAAIVIHKGDLPGAKELLDKQEAICTRNNDQVMLQACLCNTSLVYFERNQADTAFELLYKAEKIARKLGLPEGLVKSLFFQALISLKTGGQSRKAEILLKEANELARNNGLVLLEKETNALSDEHKQNSSNVLIRPWIIPVIMMSNLNFTGKPVALKVESGLVIPDWSIMSEAEIMSFIKNDGNPLMTDKDGGTSLMAAASLRSVSLTRYLIGMHVDVNALDNDGTTALMIASNKGDPEIVRLLIAEKANVNQQKADGFSPLLFAVQSGSVESVRLLLKAGADPNRSNIQGLTPLHFAAFKCKTDIAVELVKYGADPLKKAEDGSTVFDIAEDKCRELYNILRNKSNI